MDTRQFQIWLNDRGAALKPDGSFGAKTRQAVFDTFRCVAAPAAGGSDVAAIAQANGFDLLNMMALAQVESGGAGWDGAGLLTSLYERHYMWRRVQITFGLLSSAAPGGYTVDADHDGINDSWEKLADAAGRWGADKAFECASFGKFQIMGAHWKALGYDSALDFVWRLSRDETAHYEAFARFIKVNCLTDALNAITGDPEDCRAIAAGYNGKSYAKLGYHTKIAAARKAVT